MEENKPANPSEESSDTANRLDSMSVGDYARFSHQKGDVGLITVTREKLEAILSASASLSANFLTLMIGIALTIFMALRSGGVEADWQRTFWLAFWFSLVLIAFFGIATANQEWRKYKVRRELRNTPSTPVH